MNSVSSFADLIPLQCIIPTLTYILASDTIDATYFCRVDRPQALKYRSFKNTSKNAWEYFKICEISQIIHAITNFM